MLKLRVITALVLGPLIIWSVLVFSHRAIAIELGLLLTLAAWEWARLSGINLQLGRIGYAWFIAGTLLILGFSIHEYPQLINIILYASVAWWVLATILVMRANRQEVKIISEQKSVNVVMNLIAGLFILCGTFVAITALHRSESGSAYILTLLILIWVADSSAYFAGKAFGKHKLAKYVSPGKSLEGVAGALLGTAVSSVIAAKYFHFETKQMVSFIVVALVTVLLSIVGDLFESLFKRRVGLKDSSNILPGHGGIMDRIDSLVAASPIFLLGLILVGIK